MTISDVKMSAPAKKDNIGNLEQEALKRKERLKSLKRKAESSSGASSSSTTDNAPEDIPKPIFRNYMPEDERVKENAIVEEASPVDIEAELQSQLELMRTPMVIEDIDIANLAPRKPDWDLKRDVAKKFEKLERRTQKAIAELIRERLKKNQENILQAVNVGAAIRSKLEINED